MPIHQEFSSRLTLNPQDVRPQHNKLDPEDLASSCSEPIGVPLKKTTEAICIARSAPPAKQNLDDDADSDDGLSPLKPGSEPALAMPKFRRLSSILGRSEGFDMLSGEWEQQAEHQPDFPSPPPMMDLSFFGFEEDGTTQKSSNSKGFRSPRSMTLKRAPSATSDDSYVGQYTFTDDGMSETRPVFSFNNATPSPINAKHEVIPVLDFYRLDSNGSFGYDAGTFAPQQAQSYSPQEDQSYSPQLQAFDTEQKRNRPVLAKSVPDLHLGGSSLSPAIKPSTPSHPIDRPLSAMSSGSDPEEEDENQQNEQDDQNNHNQGRIIEALHKQQPRLSSSLPERTTPKCFQLQTSRSRSRSPINVQPMPSPIERLQSIETKGSPSLTALSFTPPTAALPAITISCASETKADVTCSPSLHPKTVKAVVPPSKPDAVPSLSLPGDDKISVGVYTKGQRRAKILRYQQKKNRRTGKRKVIYTCRKAFADQRPRVGGRFVKVKQDDPKPTSAPTADKTTVITRTSVKVGRSMRMAKKNKD